MRNAETTSEIRELTQDELMSVAGGNILVDLWDYACALARLIALPKAGNGDCGPNHNGV